MKNLILLSVFLITLTACSEDEKDDLSDFGNKNTLLKEANITNDSEGTRYYTYDSKYNLTQIKNDVKTITFSYYEENELNIPLLKSIIWSNGSSERKLELTYTDDDFQDINTMKISIDGETITAIGSLYEPDWNQRKLDFGSYYVLLHFHSIGIKQIRKFNSETDTLIENESHRFSYYDTSSGSIDYGYGRISDKTWMLYFLDIEEFFKIPLTYYAVSYIENLVQNNNSDFKQHSHNFKKSLLLKTKIHYEETVFNEITYKFDKLTPKTD